MDSHSILKSKNVFKAEVFLVEKGGKSYDDSESAEYKNLNDEFDGNIFEVFN